MAIIRTAATLALAGTAAALTATGTLATSSVMRGGTAVGAFFAKNGSGRLAQCDMYIPGSGKRGVICASSTGGDPNVFQEAKLVKGDGVKICSNSPGCPWTFNDPDPCPTLGVGQHVTRRPFRCRVLDAGVKCIVIASGKGFLIITNEAVRVGPPG